MSTIVTDTGFSEDTWSRGYIDLADLPANYTPSCIDISSNAEPDVLADRLTKIDMIRVDFPSTADGRGFTIARRLRLMGYTGVLRARGHVIADQYAMARRSGFDEVEIDVAMADRQPEAQWLARANWPAHYYQNRLRRAAISTTP